MTNFLFVSSLAKFSHVELFGEFSSFVMLSSFVLIFTNFGYNEYIVVNSDNEYELKSNFSILSIFSLVILLFIFFIGSMTQVKILFFLVFLKQYFENFYNLILFAVYQSKSQFKAFSFFNISYSIFVGALTCIIYKFHISILQSVAFLVAGSAILHGIMTFIQLRNLRITNIINSIKKTLNKDLFLFGLTSATVPIYMGLPLFLFSFLVSKTDQAYFYPAYSMATVLLLFSVSLNQFLLPKFKNIPYDDFMKRTRIIFISLIAFNLLILLFFILFGSWIITLLYGNEYVVSFSYLKLLILGNILQSLSSIMAVFLIANKLLKEKLRIHFELIILAIVCGALFITYFGTYGLILTFFLMYTYSFIRYFTQIRKEKTKCFKM